VSATGSRAAAATAGAYNAPSFPNRMTAMSDTPPDRLSNDPRSKFYDEALLERGIGVRFNGVERHNVEEYCVSEGWVKLPVGKALDRRGQPMTMKVKGTVEVWFLTGSSEQA
jgi:hypothetical protein